MHESRQAAPPRPLALFKFGLPARPRRLPGESASSLASGGVPIEPAKAGSLHALQHGAASSPKLKRQVRQPRTTKEERLQRKHKPKPN